MPGLSTLKDYFGQGVDGLSFSGNDCYVAGRRMAVLRGFFLGRPARYG
jgi:hypothetical protein